MTEEILNANYILYRKKLENACDMDLSSLFDDMGENIRTATFATNEDSGCAYDGSLIVMTLKNIAIYAFKLNSLIHPSLQVDTKSLVKVCLLQHISKANMFVKTEDKWKLSKGINYEFVPSTVALNVSMKSISICMKYGISLTENEIEAMTLTERYDEQAKYFSSLLGIIVRQSNELAIATAKLQYQQEKFNLNL